MKNHHLSDSFQERDGIPGADRAVAQDAATYATAPVRGQCSGQALMLGIHARAGIGFQHDLQFHNADAQNAPDIGRGKAQAIDQ